MFKIDYAITVRTSLLRTAHLEPDTGEQNPDLSTFVLLVFIACEHLPRRENYEKNSASELSRAWTQDENRTAGLFTSPVRTFFRVIFPTAEVVHRLLLCPYYRGSTTFILWSFDFRV